MSNRSPTGLPPRLLDFVYSEAASGVLLEIGGPSARIYLHHHWGRALLHHAAANEGGPIAWVR
eukprot:CAMPEP_0206504714 /NCGR_PEP_ID=MMETSP0324_2-20121206/55665_1 /ASSEMBLY_ACC=CAM_ASM_000836 /TAXON_ID=2866 /ORGANISM="Crypthecodinium cohnii, Strain Seligo" /LENGTH=62 /DNA_ID=CAMNT_0053993967 /DNA_START=64 /DNA_END=252 /DNA_ORIENTATION=+